MSVFFLLLLVAAADDAGDLTALLEQAKPKNSKTVRLAAIQKLEDVGKKDPRKTADSLLPYLGEQDADIRNVAVVAIGLSGHGQIPCPLAIVERINDSDALVSDNALAVLSLYKQLPKEAAPILFAAVKSEERRVRSSIPSLLGKAAGKSPQVLKTLRQMFADSDPLVRNNARVAHFQLTGQLKVYVPHLLHITAEREKESKPVTEGQKRKKDIQQILLVGGAIQIYEQSRLRPDDLAKELVNNLSHQDVVIRRCALRQLRAMCVSSKTSFRAVAKLTLQKELKAIADRDEDGSVSSWALNVRDILQKGPPADAPEKLKPYAELIPPNLIETPGRESAP